MTATLKQDFTLTLRDFITAIDRNVVKIFERNGVIEPMWHCITASGEHRIELSPAVDKDLAAILMRVYFVLHNVTRYAFIDEAWTLMLPLGFSDAEIREIARRGLADHPGRVEVLMYQVEDESGALTAHRNIIRAGGGKPTLGPLTFFETKESEGRFIGLLPQRGTMQ